MQEERAKKLEEEGEEKGVGKEEPKLTKTIEDEIHLFNEEKGGDEMAQVDDLDFERIISIAKGFGWQVRKQEIKDTDLELVLEKERVEPETDITRQPT